ncbi:HAMP domain-containing sensor histidine kinase [soil metagenome]
MPLRLRLTVWYGVLTGMVAVIVALVTYVGGVRAHYEDVDRRLAEVGQIYVEAAEVGAPENLSIGHPALAVRLYGDSRNIIVSSEDANLVPSLDPVAILGDPAGPTYDWLARLLPISLIDVDEADGAFGIVEDTSGDRWRVYVAPLGDEEGYVVTAASLARLDGALGLFRLLMTVMLALGGIVTVGGGWLLAGMALKPVASVTSTAAAISRERDFDRRVDVERSDEIGQLAATFNQMLDNLEETYRRELRFVGDASHELRAPLTAIQADLQLLQNHPEMADDMRQQIVSSATAEIRRLTLLVNDLLALARADAGVGIELEPVELDRALLDAMNEVRRLADGRDLRVDELTPVMVNGHRDRLVQLLIILLDNAIKYTPEGGTITVALREMEDGPELSVRDTGIGIPEADLPHVFERLYRADPARSRDPGGTGLGLSIARWIAEQHNADISIESEVGRGTTVRVAFPGMEAGLT